MGLARYVRCVNSFNKTPVELITDNVVECLLLLLKLVGDLV